MEKKMLTFNELSKEWDIPKPTLYSWVRRKLIPHVKIGPKSIRFYRDEIEQWLMLKKLPLEHFNCKGKNNL